MTRRPSTVLGIAVLGLASLRLAGCGGKSGGDHGSGASGGTNGAAASAGSGNGGGSGDGDGGSSRGGTGGTTAGAAGMARGGNAGVAGTAASGAAGSGVTPGPGCDHDGTHYDDGASWPVDCRQCFCEGDQIACTTQACPGEFGGMGGVGGMAGGASAGTGGDAGGSGEPGVKPNCMLEVGSLCIVGTPTSGGHELSVGMPMVFALRPEGCFSSSCTQLVESSCSYIGSSHDFYVSGFFCVTTEGDACTDDCGGAPEAICDAETMLTAGSYTVGLSGSAGATLSPLHFTVPGVVPERDRCTHPL